MYNVAVVGAGPVGLSVARRIREEGFDCIVLEEHMEIGKPVQCAGLISRTGCQELKLPIDSCVVNEIRGARIFSPGGEKLEVKKKSAVAYVIDRERLDKVLYRKAVAAGVEVKLDMKLIDVRGESIFTKYGGRGGLLKGQIVIGTDGANSKVRELMKLQAKPEDFVRTFQMKLKGSFEDKFVEMHFGNFAKGFFGWVIPESREVARVGVGTTDGNARKAFDDFVEKRGFEGDFYDESSAIIPVGKPIKEAVAGNLLIAGDAAFQTKSTTGGGIITGIEAGMEAAKTVADFYKHKTPLKNYEKRLKKLNKELEAHWRIRNYLNSLENEKADRLFRKLKDAGIEEFLEKEGDMDKPSRFLGKALFKPKLWKIAPELFKMIRG